MKRSIVKIFERTAFLFLFLSTLVSSVGILSSCNQGPTLPETPYHVAVCGANEENRFMLYHFPTIDEFSPLQPDGAYPERVLSVDEEAPKTHTVWLVDREWCGEYVSTERIGALVADSYQEYIDGYQQALFTVERKTGRVIHAEVHHTLQPFVETKEVAVCTALDLLRATCGETFSLELASTRTWKQCSLTFLLPMEGGEIVLAEFHFAGDYTSFSVSPFAAEMIALLPDGEDLRTSVQAKLEEVYRGGLECGSFSIKDFTLSPQDWCMTEKGAVLKAEVDVTLVTMPDGPVYPSQKGYDTAYAENSRIPQAPTQAQWNSASEKKEKLTVCITVGKDQQRKIKQSRALIRRVLYDTYFLYDYWPTGWRRQLPEECPEWTEVGGYGVLGKPATVQLPEIIEREITVMGETQLLKANNAHSYPGTERRLRFGRLSIDEPVPIATVTVGEETGHLLEYSRIEQSTEEGDFRPEDAVKAVEELWMGGALQWKVTEVNSVYRLEGYHPTNPTLLLGTATFSKSGVLNTLRMNEYVNQALSTASPSAEEIQRLLEERIMEYYRPYYDAGMVSPNPTVTWVCGSHGYDDGYIRMLPDGRLGISIKATIEHLTSDGIVEEDIMHFCIPFYS